jgi:methyltransferase (TIGR00027 family)
MRSEKPSRTALAAARHRAAHQVIEQGCIFSDPLAIRILGEDPETVVREAKEHPARTKIRLFIAVRTRYAEDALAKAVGRGVHQLVILGAGLDTCAYRSPFGDCLHIFEVDHPATQACKRQRLTKAAIPLPSWLTFVPVDFEHESLAESLLPAGFNPEQQAFFTWLGVVPYLTKPAIWSTLSYIASLPKEAHVVFDYANPPVSYSPKMRVAHDRRASRVAELGEPFVTYFETEKLHSKLTAMGFVCIKDLGPPQIVERFYPESKSSVSKDGGHVLHASTVKATFQENNGTSLETRP